MGDLIQLIGVSTTCAAALIGVVALAVRIVLVPVAKAKHLAAAAAAQAPEATARLEGRMNAPEEEVHRLGESLERVAATAEFDAQLRSGAAPPQLPKA